MSEVSFEELRLFYESTETFRKLSELRRRGTAVSLSCRLLITFFLALAISSHRVEAQPRLSAKDIVKKANDKMLGTTSLVDMTMEIIRPDWQRKMSMQNWSKGTHYYMILVTAPAREKGQVFLMRETEMWHWIPQISRTVKIPPSMMTQSWLGSDFSNNDLMRVNSLVDDYEHEIVGEDTIDGYECYKLDLTPKPEAPVVWGKVMMWISKDTFFENKIEYYDENMKLINVLVSTDMKKMDDRVIPTRLTMSVATEPGHRTVITITLAQFNRPIEDSFFSQQQMKRLRERR